jgi:hypothetical protein
LWLFAGKDTKTLRFARAAFALPLAVTGGLRFDAARPVTES